MFMRVNVHLGFSIFDRLDLGYLYNYWLKLREDIFSTADHVFLTP